MNDKANTITIEGGFTEPATLEEESPSTNTQQFLSGFTPQMPMRSSQEQLLQRSTASVIKANLDFINTPMPSGVVVSEDFLFPGFDMVDWQGNVEFDVHEIPDWLKLRRKRNAAAIALLDKWISDDLGDEEEAWHRLKKRIDESRTSTRKRFSD